MHAPVVDLLEAAIARVRPLLASGSTKARVHILWAAAKAARNLGADDVVSEQFMRLAIEVGLINERGWWLPEDVGAWIRHHGREDIAHVISWALRGMNPFEKGPLR